MTMVMAEVTVWPQPPNVARVSEEIIKRQRAGSAHEKAKHLCGIFRGGPRDLATSKGYLTQYAQKKSSSIYRRYGRQSTRILTP